MKLVGNMSQINVKINSGNTYPVPGHCIFGVKKSTTQVLLTFPDGSEFAHLNTHMAKVLNTVIDLPSVQLDALANLDTLGDTIGKAAKASDAIVRVNINLYGSKEARKDVGCLLSAGKIYLQHPDQRRPTSAYDNPHVLVLPEMQNQSVDFIPQENCEGALQGNDADQFLNAVSNVYGSLKRGSHLKRLIGDDRLRTSLLP